MRLSGWCSPCDSDATHRDCQIRIDHGWLDGCGCEKRGGHELRPAPDQTGRG